MLPLWLWLVQLFCWILCWWYSSNSFWFAKPINSWSRKCSVPPIPLSSWQSVWFGSEFVNSLKRIVSHECSVIALEQFSSWKSSFRDPIAQCRLPAGMKKVKDDTEHSLKKSEQNSIATSCNISSFNCNFFTQTCQTLHSLIGGNKQRQQRRNLILLNQVMIIWSSALFVQKIVFGYISTEDLWYWKLCHWWLWYLLHPLQMPRISKMEMQRTPLSCTIPHWNIRHRRN